MVVRVLRLRCVESAKTSQLVVLLVGRRRSILCSCSYMHSTRSVWLGREWEAGRAGKEYLLVCRHCLYKHLYTASTLQDYVLCV